MAFIPVFKKTGLSAISEEQIRLADVTLALIKKLPRIKIDQEKRQISINGVTKNFSDNIIWKALLFFAKNANKDFSQQQIENLAIKLGSIAKRPGHDIIYTIRRAVEPDSHNPQILVKSEILNSNYRTSYRLNAEVEFS